MKLTTKSITKIAVIAAIYAAMTLMPGLNALAYKEIQFRVSEVMTVLPIFTPLAIPGLTIGCLLSNIISPIGAPDMVFGTLASFLAALCSYLLRNKPKALAVLPAVISNGLIVGWMITFFYAHPSTGFMTVMLFNMLTVAAGEAAVCYILGLPFAIYINKHRNIFKL